MYLDIEQPVRDPEHWIRRDQLRDLLPDRSPSDKFNSGRGIENEQRHSSPSACNRSSASAAVSVERSVGTVRRSLSQAAVRAAISSSDNPSSTMSITDAAGAEEASLTPQPQYGRRFPGDSGSRHPSHGGQRRLGHADLASPSLANATSASSRLLLICREIRRRCPLMGSRDISTSTRHTPSRTTVTPPLPRRRRPDPRVVARPRRYGVGFDREVVVVGVCC